MKIVVMTDDGKVLDSYEDVKPTDPASAVFWPAILGWLIGVIKRGPA